MESTNWITTHEYDHDGNRQIRFVFSDESHVIYLFKTGKAFRFNRDKKLIDSENVHYNINELFEMLIGIEKSIK